MAFNGTLLRLKIKPLGVGATLQLVSEETKTDLSLTKDTFETTSKDSGAWRNRISSFKSGEIQCEAFVNYTPASGRVSFAQLFSIFDGTTSVLCEFSTDIVGNTSLQGNFHITKFDINAPTEQGATVSFTLTSDGTISGPLEPA